MKHSEVMQDVRKSDTFLSELYAQCVSGLNPEQLYLFESSFFNIVMADENLTNKNTSDFDRVFSRLPGYCPYVYQQEMFVDSAEKYMTHFECIRSRLPDQYNDIKQKVEELLSAVKKYNTKNDIIYSYDKIIVDTLCLSRGDIEYDIGKLIRNDTCESISRYINLLNKTKVEQHTVVYRKKHKDAPV
jgi:hypothetical protein